MTATERLRRLEDEVEQLKAWAGPGQVQALLDGQRALRADMAQVKVILERHDRLLQGNKKDITGLKTDVTELRTDMAEVKARLDSLPDEIVRRLREAPPAD
jgi:chromosome segregation ATPase